MRNVRQVIPQVQLVTFTVGGEEFGLDVFSVHEILRHQEVRAVPRAPDFVEGVIDVRGTLVPVVDLRRRFEVPDPTITSETRIVVVQHGDERLGVIVDAVIEVLRVAETALSPPPAYIKGLAAEFVRGLARLEGRLVILIDVAKILNSEEKIALDRATGAAGVVDAGAGER